MSLKKSRLLVAAALLALALPLWADDDEWQYISKNNIGEAYLNLPSIEEHSSYVIGWVKANLLDTEESRATLQEITSLTGREPAYYMFLYSAKKGSKQTKALQEALYDKNGRVIYSSNSNEEWEYCVPNSMNESIWKALMNAAGVKY